MRLAARSGVGGAAPGVTSKPKYSKACDMYSVLAVHPSRCTTTPKYPVLAAMRVVDERIGRRLSIRSSPGWPFAIESPPRFVEPIAPEPRSRVETPPPSDSKGVVDAPQPSRRYATSRLANARMTARDGVGVAVAAWRQRKQRTASSPGTPPRAPIHWRLAVPPATSPPRLPFSSWMRTAGCRSGADLAVRMDIAECVGDDGKGQHGDYGAKVTLHSTANAMASTVQPAPK
ncbi:hypothetical protein RJ55_05528 [Drechmeria coniospora]|nr:hypothetical protein RJ55_05528 [Drechmeria coniospora]